MLHEEETGEPYEHLSDLDHAFPHDCYDKIHLHEDGPQSYLSFHDFYGENDHLLHAAEMEILQQVLNLLQEAQEQVGSAGALQEMVEAVEVEVEAEF